MIKVWDILVILAYLSDIDNDKSTFIDSLQYQYN